MFRCICWPGLTLLATAFLLALGAGESLAQEEPSIVITAPAEEEVLSGPDITVSVALTGFTITLPLEPKREPNKGHIAYFLDTEPLFDLPTPLGDDNIIHSGRLSETFAGVADGEHVIYVCLVYDDNTCIDPALTDSVRISVGAPPPTPVPSPEATPTPEPPQDTPTPPPPPPTPSPTQEPPPLETPVHTETPPPSPTPTPPPPTSTTQPPTALPPTPTATPAAGMAPSTASDSETGFSVWYAGVAGAVALVVAGALALWWMERPRGRR